MMKRVLLTLIVTVLGVGTLSAENLVLVNGTIIDGTLKARFAGNVRIRDGKITDIGVVRPARGETALDIKGLIVSPGFVDLENRSGTALAKDLGAASQISQGITTALLGNDGTGPYAVEAFMASFDEKQPAMNIVTLVGHGTVRRQIMGGDYKRPAKEDEIEKMCELLESAMREGAFGMSADPRAEVESYATPDEYFALAKSVARYGGVYVTKLRDDEKAVESITEAIQIGRTAKIPVQISDVRVKSAEILAAIDKARMEGVDIAADTSPYDDEKELRAFLQHPWVMIASDGGIDTQHPASAGTFPRILGPAVRDQKHLTLERAIRKMTGLPASRIGLKERGTLVKGAAADVVVFDPVQVRDTSTTSEPFTAPVGIKYVFVNGTMVVKDGQPTGEHPGLPLR